MSKLLVAILVAADLPLYGVKKPTDNNQKPHQETSKTDHNSNNACQQDNTTRSNIGSNSDKKTRSS